MRTFVPEDIDAYAHAHTKSRGDLLEDLRKHTQNHVDFPQMQVGRVEGTFLKTMVAVMGAKRILEIGTYTGYSALCMAEALPEDGKLITCDMSEEYTAVARTYFAKSPHGSKIELRLGDAMDSLNALEDEPLDMAFLDADKARYPEYYELIVPKLRSNGLLVIDNVLWSGGVLDPQTDDARGIATVNSKATSDERVDNVLLTVRDGIMLVRKR